jgi:hypothetical protein
MSYSLQNVSVPVAIEGFAEKYLFFPEDTRNQVEWDVLRF